MRTIILCCVPIVTAILGYLFSARFAEEKDFWNNFEFWHKKIKSEISFTQNSLHEILSEENDKDVFLSSAKAFFKNGITPALNFLSEKENAFFNEYLHRLGTSDKESQIAFLNSMESELLEYVKKSNEKYEKFRPLYVKLGFLFGLILFILVV